jgi:hypothetical protein
MSCAPSFLVIEGFKFGVDKSSYFKVIPSLGFSEHLALGTRVKKVICALRSPCMSYCVCVDYRVE